jgi:hypothetical protein
MTNLSQETRDELRRLHEAATPAPWLWERDGCYGDVTNKQNRFTTGRRDAEMIAAMRNALPALLDAADALDLQQNPHKVARVLDEKRLVIEENTRLRTENEALDGGNAILADANSRLRAKLNVVVKALDRIAAWGDGETVASHFDEPGSAVIAREALAAIRDGQQKACPECGNDRGHHHALCGQDADGGIFVRKEAIVPAELAAVAKVGGGRNGDPHGAKAV